MGFAFYALILKPLSIKLCFRYLINIIIYYMASLVFCKEFFNKVKELFGRYIITKEEFHENWMGNEKSGNFAKVTKGTFRGKQVALKKIKLTKDSVKSLMKDQNELSSILTELSILTKVNNDNIPKLEGICILEDKLELFFLLQFIDGSTLQDLFLNKVHWNYQQKLLIAYRLAKILVYITSEGVIHRDVKPENIMIENDSNLEPYLIDFGFSKIKQSDKQYTFSCAKCTPLYSPPENIYTDDCYAKQIGSTLDSLQMKIDDSTLTKISYKVDVWSFGCVLFELFSGKLPWMYLFSNLNHALTVKDILDKFSKNYTLYSQEDKKNFPEIIYIVEHCTKTNVNQRWEIVKVFQEVEKLVHKQRYVDKEEIDNSIYNGELIKVIDNDGNSTTLYDGEGKLITEMDDEESKVVYGGNYEYGNKANFGVEIGSNYKYIGNWRTHLKNGFGYFWINEYDQA